MQPQTHTLGAIVALATGIAATGAALAQQSPAPTRPDAGTLMRQMEPGDRCRLPKLEKP